MQASNRTFPVFGHRRFSPEEIETERIECSVPTTSTPWIHGRELGFPQKHKRKLKKPLHSVQLRDLLNLHGSQHDRESLSHCYLGFTQCGNYLLSYSREHRFNLYEFSSIPQNYHAYTLHFWLLENLGDCSCSNRRGRKVKSVRIFPNSEDDNDMSITIAQWPSDNNFLVVHGALIPSVTGDYSYGFNATERDFQSEDDEECQRPCFVSILKVPHPSTFVASRVTPEATKDDLGCEVHTSYCTVTPHPKFEPKWSMAAPGWLILNSGDSLIGIRVSNEPIGGATKQRASQTPPSVECFLHGRKRFEIPPEEDLCRFMKKAEHRFSTSVTMEGDRIRRSGCDTGFGFLLFDVRNGRSEGLRHLCAESLASDSVDTAIHKNLFYVRETNLNVEALIDALSPLVCAHYTDYQYEALSDYDVRLIEVNADTGEAIAAVFALIDVLLPTRAACRLALPDLLPEDVFEMPGTGEFDPDEDDSWNPAGPNYCSAEFAFVVSWNFVKGEAHLVSVSNLEVKSVTKIVRRCSTKYVGISRYWRPGKHAAALKEHNFDIPNSVGRTPWSLSNAPLIEGISLPFLKDSDGILSIRL